MSADIRWTPELKWQCWAAGILHWKLFEYQKPLYKSLMGAIEDPQCKKYVLNCSRRYGKTTILCLIALEHCLKTPNTYVRFAAPSGKELKNCVRPIMNILCKDAPAKFKPKFKKQENVYEFYNGSEIHMSGTDNGNADSLRGTTSHLNLVDEAGFCDDLTYLVDSILFPQIITTDGTTLLASTPSITPDHDYFHIAQECITKNAYSKYTIYDNAAITDQERFEIADEIGGYESSTWKREFLAEFVVDENSVIIPEWDDKYIQITYPDEFYSFYHRYVGMDLGVKDFTACVFGYWDFKQAKLIIEDELTLNGPSLTTILLKDEIKSKEKELWDNLVVYKRVSDSNNPLLLQDLGNLHQLYFQYTTKDSLEAMLNVLRMMIAKGQIIVNPKCKQTIGCLNYALWDKNKSKLARSHVYGHFDHLMALVYLVRNLDLISNPIPPTYGLDKSKHFISKELLMPLPEGFAAFSSIVRTNKKKR